MEHRVPRPTTAIEPPREATAGGIGPAPALNPPPRNLSRRRLVRAGLVTGLTTAGLVLARLGWLRGERWLETRPARRLPFTEIALDPPPPKWIKGGPSALLSEVRRGSGLPEAIDALAIPADDLRRAFRNHSHWVAEVGTIRRTYPNKVSVAIRYREPVAEVVDGKLRTLALLDDEAIVLPDDSVQRGAAGILVRIDVKEAPGGIRIGRAWPGPGRVEDITQPDPDMADLCKLAGFIKQAERARGADAIGFKQIKWVDGLGLFLVSDKNKWLRWRTKVASEPSTADPEDAEKWRRLGEWLQEDKPWPSPGGYLYFDPNNHGALAAKKDKSSGG
ncbi:MAG: hypothetical protein U0800_10560 [Isosphaeraceae bacterium]